MLAMQYAFTLPADYDMDIIRARVSTKCVTYDRLPHLGFKAFLITEQGKDGNHENSYAPFYLWQEPQGMHDFFGSDKFQGLVQSFGWPTIRTWSILDVALGNTAVAPLHATRELVQIASYADLQELYIRELAEQREAMRSSHVHSRLVAFEPTTWTLVRFTLWEVFGSDERRSQGMQHYEVLHLSAPMWCADQRARRSVAEACGEPSS